MGMQLTIWKEMVVAYSFLLILPCWNREKDARREKIEESILGVDLFIYLLLLLLLFTDWVFTGWQ